VTTTTHVHFLKRGRYRTGTYFFKCQDCPFIVVAQQATGRTTRCHKCREPFIMTRNDTKWARPVCPMCRNKPSNPEAISATTEVSAVEALMDDLLGEDKK
jgi:formylmethanofuran dehydrogenase subunit E